MKYPKIACIISCYNEEKNIPVLIDEILKYDLNKQIFFVLVDNASTDLTSQIFEKNKNKYEGIKFVINKIDKGWGYGIKYGLKYTNSDIIGWTHSDLQYDIKDLVKVLDIIKKNIHNLHNENFLIKGRRKSRKIFEKFFSLMMQFICSIILKKKFTEINAQPVFLNTKQLDNLNLPDGLEMDLYLYYNCILNNSKIFRFDVTQDKRFHGTSSWNNSIFSKVKLSLRFLKHAIKIRNG